MGPGAAKSASRKAASLGKCCSSPRPVLGSLLLAGRNSHFRSARSSKDRPVWLCAWLLPRSGGFSTRSLWSVPWGLKWSLPGHQDLFSAKLTLHATKVGGELAIQQNLMVSYYFPLGTRSTLWLDPWKSVPKSERQFQVRGFLSPGLRCLPWPHS